MLRGGRTAKERREEGEQLRAIPSHEDRVILATGRFAGEGFDDARLDTLFLTMPVSWKGTRVQYAGRLHRSYPGKDGVQIFDYFDSAVRVLARMFEKRRRGYAAMEYRPGCPGATDFPPARRSAARLGDLHFNTLSGDRRHKLISLVESTHPCSCNTRVPSRNGFAIPGRVRYLYARFPHLTWPAPSPAMISGARQRRSHEIEKMNRREQRQRLRILDAPIEEEQLRSATG